MANEISATASGIVVCAFIIGLGLSMAVRGVRQLWRSANAVTINDKK